MTKEISVENDVFSLNPLYAGTLAFRTEKKTAHKGVTQEKTAFEFFFHVVKMFNFNVKVLKMRMKSTKEIAILAGNQPNNFTGKICRMFMITQSGAEGISLKNVRQVHMMEPFWNYVRLEQVQGRAIRICSHKDLPLDIFQTRNP
jgi:hypothetical protein